MAKRLTADHFSVEVQVLYDLVMQRFQICDDTKNQSYGTLQNLTSGYVQSFLINLAFEGGSKEGMLRKIKDRCFNICIEIQDRKSN
jgi:hypothetical protein